MTKQQIQDSNEEDFGLDLTRYQCYSFTNDEGSTVYLYDRRDDL